ncbi:MAG: lipoyl synthase [Armatimonadota bacterium]|nr:lipoyl synthase [Armatimonadota bacterium]MDR7422876.1 lipoyl synthase [Armatimonadota bacterium]MDR7453814.1 lipoyl synthase [Armatimonadota bacterium]MDR7455935.1 lipoyl synthase [Armatimonadota bacterium]MDR7497863.1 lipoyl synthase [Armatimonadota bacterium]
MAVETRRPEWLKARLPAGANYVDLKAIMRGRQMHTVCEEARCPNIGECWDRRTATFLILGNVCTRACAYCAIAHGLPSELDLAEPARLADACAAMGLRHAVITSVNRDDLADGGAAVYAEAIRQIHRRLPECTVEVLIPDFKGDPGALRTVLDANPEILAHNIESVRRVFKIVRGGGSYDRSLVLLRRAKEWGYTSFTKSGLILGMGETTDEIVATMDDLRAVDVDVLTLGQYLRPSPDHHPIDRYVTPQEFAMLREEGLRRGFRYVESGPLVRSSYRADVQAQAVRAHRARFGRGSPAPDPVA